MHDVFKYNKDYFRSNLCNHVDSFEEFLTGALIIVRGAIVLKNVVKVLATMASRRIIAQLKEVSVTARIIGVLMRR